MSLRACHVGLRDRVDELNNPLEGKGKGRKKVDMKTTLTCE